MTVSDNTKQAEVLGDFFKNLGKKGLNVSKKIAKNPGRALEIGANAGTAFAQKLKSGLIIITRGDKLLLPRKMIISRKFCISFCLNE